MQFKQKHKHHPESFEITYSADCDNRFTNVPRTVLYLNSSYLLRLTDTPHCEDIPLQPSVRIWYQNTSDISQHLNTQHAAYFLDIQPSAMSR